MGTFWFIDIHSLLQARRVLNQNVPIFFIFSYHHFDFKKYRHRVLAEAQYRINRRFDLPSLVGRPLWAAARTRPYPEHWLRLAETRVS